MGQLTPFRKKDKVFFKTQKSFLDFCAFTKERGSVKVSPGPFLKMKKLTQKQILIGTSLIGIVLFYFVIKQIGITNIIEVFKNLSYLFLIPFLTISLLIHVGNAYRWKMILNTQGHKISFWKLFNFKVVGYSLSYVTPSAQIGGEVLRAYLLKREKVPYHKAYSSILIDKVLELSTAAIFMIIGIFVILFHVALPRDTFWAFIAIISIFTALLILIYTRLLTQKYFFHWILYNTGLMKIKFIKKYEKNIIKTENLIIHFLKNNKKVCLKLSLVTAGVWGIMFLEYKFIGLMIGQNLSIMIIFLIIAVVGISYLIPLPAALGALEGGQASLFSAIGLNPAEGVTLGLVVRIRDAFITFIGFIILTRYGINAIENKKIEDNKKITLIPEEKPKKNRKKVKNRKIKSK